MAIYHLSSSIISRSQGRSAVACSAYRSGSELFDEKYNKTHDYSLKQDVEFTEIITPKGAPEWMKNREMLWNAIEAREKRKDAQLAREIQIALPRELTKEQNIELAREFIQKEFVDLGMIADWALHVDKTKEGETQPHIHVMLTMREINDEGFGQKVRKWNGKENLLLWRENWAEVANRHLALNGHDICIDHRSNVERGIELEPQYKIGASVASAQMARLLDHQRIAFENGEKIFLNPDIALSALTRQQSTFTHQDLARFVNRHTKDQEQFVRVYEKVKSSDQIIALGIDERGRERFTTTELLDIEKRMMTHSNLLIDRLNHAVGQNIQQQGMLSRDLSAEQVAVYQHVLTEGDLKCVVGYAGTGKSYLLGSAKEAWEAQGYRVMGTTLSGIAAENLEASSGIESRTLASRMYYWDKGEELLTNHDVVVVDEAGMIGSRQMARLLDEAQTHHTKVVLIGDPQQLQAIEAGASFRAISDQIGYIELTEIRRQREGWQRVATKELANGKTMDAITRYKVHSHVHEFETQAVAKKTLVEMWNDARISESDKTQIMLAHTRKDVYDLNHMARDVRKALGELGEERILTTAKGEKPFSENDRVYFLQNDRELQVKNGSLGTIEKMEGHKLTVCLDRENAGVAQPHRVTVDLKQYNHLDYGYAATIHKAQGVTVDRSYVLASKGMDSHLAYVGMSRHRESADLFWSREEFANERVLAQSLNRERYKDVTLDYNLGKAFAEHRCIEASEKLTKALQPELSKEMTKKQNFSAELSKELSTDTKEVKRFNIDDRYERHVETIDTRLNQFRQNFERENTNLEKPLSEKMLTESEKRAMAVEKAFAQLDKRIECNPQDYAAKRDIAKLATEISREKSTMQYLKDRAPDLNERIQKLAYERERERSLERGRER